MALAPDPETPSTRILFIGNSYTSRNQLPRLIADLAATTERPARVEVDAIVAGGASLRRHWNAGRAQAAMVTTRWDYVVLQEQSTLPVKNPVRYHENVRLFAAEIERRGAQPALYLTWSRQQAPQTQELITRAVEDIAAEVGARVVPVGPAWHAAAKLLRELALYTNDGSHPTPAGSYLAGCVFVATLFGERPSGFSLSDKLKIGRDIAAQLQALAWDTRGR